MLTQVCLSLALIAALPAWAQGDANASAADTNLTDQAPMLIPASVGDRTYPTTVGSEVRSNYLRAGITFNSAYSDNIFGGGGVGKPISDISYSIFPTIAIDQTLPRLHWILLYSPGFTVYQRTSAYDQTNQNVGLDFRYRLSPHVTASLRDSLQKTSNVFNQPDPFSGGAVSGSAQPLPINLIVPVANQLRNMANAGLTYQFRRNGMIGANGTLSNLHFSELTQVPGLSDSNSIGGSGFYNYRLSRRHYVGAAYQYARILTYPLNAKSETDTQAVLLFYTIYLKPTFSVSLSGGPQHYSIFQSPLSPYGAWSPTLTASVAWQGNHTNFAASYSRIVTGGGGLVGAFHLNSVNAFARWQFARTWSLGGTGGYEITANATPSSFLASHGGFGIFGTVSVQHQFSERFTMDIGYTRLHQEYSDIPVISSAPNTNREVVSFTYQFARPL